MSRFDVVVIGSGAGGAPVACRAAEAGMKVLLVERGRAYRREEFDRDEIEWCRRDRLVPSPLTDPHTRRRDEGQRAMPTTDGWISTVLGGGTVHFGAYLLRAHPSDAKQATRCAHEQAHTALDWAVPFANVEKFYAQAEHDLGVSGAPSTSDTLPALQAHPLADVVDRAATKLQMSSIPTPRGILTAPRPDDDRLPCGYRQLCASYGCPNDARASMPATYLRRAQKTGRLTVRTQTLCTRLLAHPDGSRARGAELVDIAGAGTREIVEADRIVVACGAIESARLLLLSGRPFSAGGQVGKNLWFSLFVEVSGFFEQAAHGDVASLLAGSPFLNRTIAHGAMLDGARARSAGVDRTGMFEASFVHDNPIHRAERVATEGGRLLWGAALKKALRHEFLDGRRVILEGFGEMLPHAGCYVDLDPAVKDARGQPVARMTVWHHPRDQRVAAQMGKDGVALLQEAGASDVRVTRPLSETLVLQGGTCRFGTDPATSVTDVDGALHSVPNVYVTDGGSLPSSLAAPTTLTIVANALRIADGIVGVQRP